MGESTEQKQKQNSDLVVKLFLNEKGEISLRKIGIIAAGLGTTLIMSPIPYVPIIIGKYLAGLGGICTALGQFSKMDRDSE